MKRFLKTLVFLIVSLFLVVSGVNTGLDHLSRSTSLSTLTQYDAKGAPRLTYSGDINHFRPYLRHTFFTEFHYIRGS